MSKQTEMGRDLLPWYVNRTLSESEKAKLDLLKANSESFQRELDAEEKVAARFSDQNEPELEDILQQQPASFEQLRQKIAAQKNIADAHNVVPVAPKTKAVRARKYSGLLALAASVLLAAAVSFTVYFNPDEPIDSGDFKVLTNPSTHSGIVVQLVFAPTVSSENIQSLLQNSSAELLSGPTNNGVYRIRIQNEGDLESWRQLDEVIWTQREVE